MTAQDPHGDAGVEQAGPPLARTKGLFVLLHGRGGSAADMLSLGRELWQPDVTYLAPQALNNSWYPYSFLAPLSENEPWLSSALRRVDTIVKSAIQEGVPAERVIVCGFSQGACLATEYLHRHPQRLGAIIAFTGGLIGPPGTKFDRTGDLAKTPVYFGSGDPDPHVPWERVQESANVLTQMGATVTAQRFPGRPHTITEPELVVAKRMIDDVFREAPLIE